MTALSSQQRTRYQQLADFLRSAVRSVRELPNGYEFEFALESVTRDALSEIAPLEQACCPFFTTTVRLEREGGKLWVAVDRQGRREAFYSR